MKYHTTYQLHTEMLHAETSNRTLAAHSKCLWQNVIYRFGYKMGIYLLALSTAARLHNPPAGSLDIDSAVPVEGVRTLVDWDG